MDCLELCSLELDYSCCGAYGIGNVIDQETILKSEHDVVTNTGCEKVIVHELPKLILCFYRYLVVPLGHSICDPPEVFSKWPAENHHFRSHEWHRVSTGQWL